jgi:predicted transcriptional regulator
MRENKREKESVDLVTTTVSFDRETYRRIQHLAVDADLTVRDLIREAVTDYLARKEKKGERR